MKDRDKYSHPNDRVRRLLVLSLLLVTALSGKAPFKADGTVFGAAASTSHLRQDPNQAENYRKLAATKRRAAENVPAKRDCYLAWARYYDCLAARSEAGDDRDCGARPPDC